METGALGYVLVGSVFSFGTLGLVDGIGWHCEWIYLVCCLANSAVGF